MPAAPGVGTSSAFLGVPGTVRQDISEYIAAVLKLADNAMAALSVGPEFGDTVCRWVEDRLNNDYVTDTQSGGLPTGSAGASGQLILSAADASIIRTGAQLVDVSATTGGLGGGEMLYVVSTNAQSGVIQVTRGWSGTTPSAHAQGAVYSVIGMPTIEGSSLGPDTSRARIPRWNYLERQEINVVLSMEAIVRSQAGYAPGVRDELEYQFFRRAEEVLRLWNKSFLYGRPYAGVDGSSGQQSGSYSSFAGLYAWLDGTFVSSAFSDTQTTVNWQTQGWPNGGIDYALNYGNLLIQRNGAIPSAALFGFNSAQAASRLYRDTIRIEQSENERGFMSDHMVTPLGNRLEYVLDGKIDDSPGIANIFLLDLDRIRIRPFIKGWFYAFTAPTLQDGDAFRALSKCSLEVRNASAGAGQAHVLITNGTMG
jgi:hypothetical protein